MDGNANSLDATAGAGPWVFAAGAEVRLAHVGAEPLRAEAGAEPLVDDTGAGPRANAAVTRATAALLSSSVGSSSAARLKSDSASFN